MKTVKVKLIEVRNINKASVTMEIFTMEGSIICLATRRVANKLLKTDSREVIIVEKIYNDKTYKWLALPSIF